VFNLVVAVLDNQLGRSQNCQRVSPFTAAETSSQFLVLAERSS
jgi:hypothetical protein